MAHVFKGDTGDRLLRHIMDVVGNQDMTAESVAALVSQLGDGEAQEAKRDALLNAASDGSSDDEEEAILKRDAPINCGHIVTWGVPVSVEAVCCARLEPRRA